MATQRIREFSEGVQYVLGDVALYNDAASSTTIVKRCKKNTPIGEFQANDWEDIFSFPTSKKNLQGVINTAERITTQTLLYGERMSRVTAIPHLIPQTKMVKVMQALEKRAPRSTENVGGKEYKLKGNVYCSIDRQTTDGKDITDVGYFPVLGTIAKGLGFKKNMLVDNNQDIITISADLPFIQTMFWGCAPEIYYAGGVVNDDYFYMEETDYSKYNSNTGWGFFYNLMLDQQKPFAAVYKYKEGPDPAPSLLSFFKPHKKLFRCPAVSLTKPSDTLVALTHLPPYLSKFNVPADGDMYQYKTGYGSANTINYQSILFVRYISSYIKNYESFSDILVKNFTESDNPEVEFKMNKTESLNAPNSGYNPTHMLFMTGSNLGPTEAFDRHKSIGEATGFMRLSFVMK